MLFYAFKFSSIMFKDSNFVGTYGLVAFFYYYYLKKKKYVNSVVPLIILFILILLTLSRSAIITVPLTIVILYFLRIKIKLHHILLGIALIMSVVFIALPQIESDGSFLSKFDILELTWRHLQECSIGQFLFGVGFGDKRFLFRNIVLERGFKRFRRQTLLRQLKTEHIFYRFA